MTPDQLRAAVGCSEAVATVFAKPLSVAVERYGIARVPEFVAQIAVESRRLRSLQEDLTYRTTQRLIDVYGKAYFPTPEHALPYINNPEKLANYVYDDRNPARRHKLGNVHDGDGWKYRGRGLKQLTGRANYEAYAKATQIPVDRFPDMLLDPIFAADSAAWFWSVNNCDALADDVTRLTRRVNGGLNGLHERIVTTRMAREAFDVA